jgi:hypothetical protein
MFKNFLMKKLLQAQTKNLPKEQQEMVMIMLEKDPDLFMKIAKEVQEEMKKGKSQMHAAMGVMPKYQAQIQKLMAESKK